jgi:hypothetical protein
MAGTLRRGRLALLIGAALSVAAPVVAGAHRSGCHSHHSCPSDHHTYVWYDSSGQGWSCAEPGAAEYNPRQDTTTIVYAGLTYYCYVVGQPPPPPVGPAAPSCTDVPVNAGFGTSTSITLTCSGPAGVALTFSTTNSPSHGTISNLDAAVGTLTYTPTQGYSGSDSFQFQASDAGGASNIATVSIAIAGPPPQPSPPPPVTPQPTGGPCHYRAGGALPDSECTPGVAFAVGTSSICVPGYSRRVRHMAAATKRRVFAEYGITSHRPGEYEVDHVIPLELGGSNAIANLWPERANPPPGFHQKDRLENRLHQFVCTGGLSLATAQRAIARNWLTAYQRYVR